MVVFIIRDFPDLDHIFPIIHIFLKKKKATAILNFEINLDLNIDTRIVYLKKKYKNNFVVHEVYNIKGKRFFKDWIINFLSFAKYKKINFKNLNHIIKNNNLLDLCFLFLICYLKKIIFSSNSIFDSFFFNDKWAYNIINKLNIKSLVLDDSYFFTFNRPKSFINIAKANNIKITLVPHTCNIFTNKDHINDLKLKKFKNFYPNIVVTSKRIKSIYNRVGIESSKIKNLGSARFCLENRNFLKSFYSKNFKFVNKDSTGKQIKVLYIDGAYDDNFEKQKLIEYISKLSYIDLVIKAHPRGIFSLNQILDKEKRFKKNNFSNFSIDISTPTKMLIEHNDIIIGTYSSVLIEAMLSNKKIILPKFLLKDKSFKIFYETYGFAEVCTNLKKVSSSLHSFQKNEMTKKDTKLKINAFIKEYVYGGQSDSSQILQNYYQLIK